MTGLTVMIVSFRQTVSHWIDSVVVADLLIAPASNEIAGLGATIPQETIEWLQHQPDVDSVDTFRQLRVNAVINGSSLHRIPLGIVGGTFRNNLQLTAGEASQLGARLQSGEAIAVSEPFAQKQHVRVGDRITFESPAGPVSFPVAAIYTDFARDEGTVLMMRPAFDRYWKEPDVFSLSVYVRSPDATGRVAEEFRLHWSAQGEYTIYSNRTLRQRVLTIFDQTFAVTALLRVIAIVVAVIGIFLSISTLVLERERETGTLRAVGASQGQVVRLTLFEAGFIGAVASVLGLLAGGLLAIVLTRVVNPAFFGWTIQLFWPWPTLLATPLWIIATAAAAALLPARRGAAVNIAQAVREE
jgi:putative ABC transport system permease protein